MAVTITADGFFTASPSDKARYLRNKLKGVNRI